MVQHYDASGLGKAALAFARVSALGPCDVTFEQDLTDGIYHVSSVNWLFAGNAPIVVDLRDAPLTINLGAAGELSA